MAESSTLADPSSAPPGVTLRPYRGPADLPGMAAARAACGARDQIDPFSSLEIVPTVEGLAAALAPAPGFDPGRDLPAPYAAMNACYVNHALSPERDEQSYKEWLAEQTDLSEWHVAWDAAGGALAGQVRAAPTRDRGGILECSVAAPYRRRGVGRALLAAGLAGLAQRGFSRTRLYTLRENPNHSWALYESAGFRTIKRFDRYRKAS